jgi:type I restriction enzyme S subunit
MPAHWLTTKLKWSASLITSGSRGWAQFYADEGDYFVRIGNLSRGSLGFDDSNVQCVQIPSGAEGSRTMTRSGDLLFSITAYLGSVAVVDSAHAGAYVSQHVSLVRLSSRRLDPSYAGYVSLSEVGQRQLTEQAYGGTKIQLSLDDIGNLEVPLPDVDEQRHIAKFLYRETAKVDALIVKQEQLIATLREDRTATITHAVTKGLDPSADIKNSEVQWLGEIPAHWQVLKATRIGRPFGSEAVPEADVGSEGDVTFLKVSSLRPDALYPDEPTWYVSKRYRTEQNFIVFPKRGAAIFGNKVNIVRDHAVIDPNLMGWKLSSGNVPEFFAQVLKLIRLEEIADVSTVPQINTKHLASLCLPRPPLAEQHAIVAALAESCETIDVLIAKANEVIATLREYRAALITDAVTGKIDVRGVA